MFNAAFPENAAGRPIAFNDISNAIAALIEVEWRSDASTYDAHLRGAGDLSPEAITGAELFFGPAGCSICHSGKFFSDQGFHAMGAPQTRPRQGRTL